MLLIASVRLKADTTFIDFLVQQICKAHDKFVKDIITKYLISVDTKSRLGCSYSSWKICWRGVESYGGKNVGGPGAGNLANEPPQVALRSPAIQYRTNPTITTLYCIIILCTTTYILPSTYSEATTLRHIV